MCNSFLSDVDICYGDSENPAPTLIQLCVKKLKSIDNHGNNPLHKACYVSFALAEDMLLWMVGATQELVNEKNDTGMMALHVAVKQNYI